MSGLPSCVGMTVCELMTTPAVTCDPHEMVFRVEARMVERGFRHLPVVDQSGRLVGMLTDRDVRSAAGCSRDKQIAVEAAMSKELHTASPSMPVSEALDVMLRARVGALPVVDEAGAVQGIVTGTDYLTWLQRMLREDTAVAPSSAVG